MKNQKFSHKTPHLKGKQHQLDPNLDLKQLVHHATVQYVDRDADGDVDVYDNPRKGIPDENVSSAADAEKFSKKLIAKQKGEIKHTKVGMAYEQTKSGDSSLRDWFTKSRSSDGTPGWVQLGGKYAGKPCAKQPGQTTKPKCGSSKMKANLSDDEEQKAFRRKNREDPNPDRRGEAKMVATEEKDACYKKVKSRYKIWPSAYASGALVKCRKVGAANWGNKSEGFEYSNWRDDFKATEYEFIDLIKPNPIKMDSLQEKAMHTHEGNEEERYCPLCKKRETRSECSYGEKAWDRVSVKDEEYSMVRSEISTIEDAVKRLRAKVAKGEGNLEAWVQSKITKAADYIDTAADYVQGGEMDEACWSGYKQVGMKKKGKKTVPNCVPEETVTEGVRLPADNGNLMMVIAMWKGKSYSLKMFFPQLKVPSKKEVEEQIQKVYPGARVIYSRVCEQEPGQPFLYVNGDRGSFGPSRNYVKPMGEETELEEGLRKRLATGALAAGLGAAALSGGAAKAGNWSGQVNARYGSVPAVATDSSISSAVDKALAKPGTAQSASEIKGKQGVTGSANLSYSGTLGKAPESSKPKVKDDTGTNTQVRRSSQGRTPPKVVLKKDKGGDKIVKDVKKDDGKPIKYSLGDKGDKPKPVSSRTVKSGGDEPVVRPGRGPAGQQLRGAIASIRDATGENKREAEHQAALGPTHANGRQLTAAQRLRGAIDAIRTATDSSRKSKSNVSEENQFEDWQKVNRQDKTDGLSQAAVDAYRRENPGSKLQTAVTEKKPTGKRAKRRANFCRRMKGMKERLTSAETARDPDSRINKALRRWRCN